MLPADPLILDLCTGTGDLALELSRGGRLVGCDFCRPMLVRAVAKARKREAARNLPFVEGDALQLPFPDGAFDAVTIAFGLRNLEDYRAGLREIHRVLRPGGVLGVLEFSLPTLPVLRPLYLFYFTRILPAVGRLVSGKDGPYSYLPASVRQFPEPAALRQLMRQVGFGKTTDLPLSLRIATLTLAERPSSPGSGPA
jgi:demethylmenaquinone methyltransferase/2-methoxy-6-polyprenyl-1,4-benzoquinol methylase